MAYHYYKPIHQLAQYMKQDNENSEDRSRDELVFIKHQYEMCIRDRYYRLNTLPVLIPPLCRRGEDVFLLMERFCRELKGEFVLSEAVSYTHLDVYKRQVSL